MNGSVGQALRDARLAKKLTIDEVARATKIRPERIADLEQDDYMRFPNVVYARNFLILYAKYLRVDISRYPTVEIGFDTGVSEYSYLQQDDGSGAAPAGRRQRRRSTAAMPPEKPRWLIAFFIFLVAFAAAALVGWTIMTIKRLGPVGTPPKAAASATPPATPTPTPAEPPISGSNVLEPVRRAEPVTATEAPAQMPGADPVAVAPEPPVKVAVPVPAAAAVATPNPSPAAAEPTPVVEGEEMEIAIRSSRKIRLRVVRDDPKSPSVYHGSLNPQMKKPLVFVGKHFWIKTADPDALKITIDGKPAPASVVEVIPTPGI